MACRPHPIIFNNNPVRTVFFQEFSNNRSLKILFLLDIFTSRPRFTQQILPVFLFPFFTGKNQCLSMVVKQLILKQIRYQAGLSGFQKQISIPAIRLSSNPILKLHEKAPAPYLP